MSNKKIPFSYSVGESPLHSERIPSVLAILNNASWKFDIPEGVLIFYWLTWSYCSRCESQHKPPSKFQSLLDRTNVTVVPVKFPGLANHSHGSLEFTSAQAVHKWSIKPLEYKKQVPLTKGCACCCSRIFTTSIGVTEMN